MQNLLEIDGVTREACSLLEAAGYTDLEALRSNSPELIHAELSKANKMLTIIDQDPSLEMVRSWCGCSIEDAEPSGLVVTASKGEPIVAVKDPIRVKKKTALALSEAFIENQKIELADLPKVTIVAEKSEKKAAPAKKVAAKKPTTAKKKVEAKADKTS